MTTKKNVLVPLADGFEEIEAITIIDVLRRAGADVISAGLEKRNVRGGKNIHIICDSVLEDEMETNWDMIVLPGGTEGVNNLKLDSRIKTLLEKQQNENKTIAAICAAPTILDSLHIPGKETITVHPAVSNLIQHSQIKDTSVIEHDKLITGRSAGAAMAFSLALVKKLFGNDKVKKVNKGLIFSEK